MAMQLQLGLEVIHSYKRLSYTPWHAIAELVDNATQSYLNSRKVLDEALAASDDKMTVGIVYDHSDKGMLRVSDNAMGMSADELRKALIVGIPPANTSGRSKYGMGMKTASCWIGNEWTVRTKKLGETQEHTISIDVEKVGSGNNDLPHSIAEGKPEEAHYTVIEIRDHNKRFQGRTLGKIRDFLRSMYRQDLRNGVVAIEWQGTPLQWDDSDYQFLRAPDGTAYKKNFEFSIDGKDVYGWVGVLERGSRAKAGFSILHADRVVRGWPDSWRPESLYGQLQGSNDLINQRLIGEIHLDAFEVSHTKDDILWFGDDEDAVQISLKKFCSDYAVVAKTRRKGSDDDRGPSETETQAAIDELVTELSSPELKDIVILRPVPPPEAVDKALVPLKEAISAREPTFRSMVAQVEVLGYLVNDGSLNDPYVVVDSTGGEKVMIGINTQHPHWKQLLGSEGVLNYLRHCIFDGIAEWKARHKASRLDPDTIKLLKDDLLRLPLEIEMHQNEAIHEDSRAI